MQKLLQSRKPSYWWTLAGVLALSVLTYGGQDIHTSMATWPALMHAFGAWLSNPFAIVSVLASVWGVSFNPRTEAVTQTAWGVSVRGTDSDTTAPSKPAEEPTVTTTDPQEVTDDDDTGD